MHLPLLCKYTSGYRFLFWGFEKSELEAHRNAIKTSFWWFFISKWMKRTNCLKRCASVNVCIENAVYERQKVFWYFVIWCLHDSNVARSCKHTRDSAIMKECESSFRDVWNVCENSFAIARRIKTSMFCRLGLFLGTKNVKNVRRIMWGLFREQGTYTEKGKNW